MPSHMRHLASASASAHASASLFPGLVNIPAYQQVQARCNL